MNECAQDPQQTKTIFAGHLSDPLLRLPSTQTYLSTQLLTILHRHRLSQIQALFDRL